MSSCCDQSQTFGSNPVIMQWDIVRGDTAPLRVDFLQDDEVTPVDISNWTVEATTYSPKDDASDELEVVIGNGYIDITAPADITGYWGTGYSSIVSELLFDVQVTIDDRVWTPIVGTIRVIGDVTGGSL
jgi:hypothetical protein